MGFIQTYNTDGHRAFLFVTKLDWIASSLKSTRISAPNLEIAAPPFDRELASETLDDTASATEIALEGESLESKLCHYFS